MPASCQIALDIERNALTLLINENEIRRKTAAKQQENEEEEEDTRFPNIFN